MTSFDYKFVYHSHTTRCHHAIGGDEELILAAIKQGVKILCFTDHTPTPFIRDNGLRMNYEQLDEYVSTINSLKEKYKDQIEIHIGLEAENLLGNNDYLYDYVKNRGIEFLIIGQHIIQIGSQYPWIGDQNFDRKARIDAYVDSITDALDNGLSKYVAHPDFLISCLNSFDKEVEHAMRKIVKCAIKNNAFLEFNVHGIKNCNLREFGYPNMYFFKMIKDEYPEAKVVIGMDVHSIEEYTDNIYLVKALEILNEIGIKPVEYIDFEKELKWK